MSEKPHHHFHNNAAFLIDFTTMKKWVPDPTTATEVVNTSGSITTWTATQDGFIRAENNSYNLGNYTESFNIKINSVLVFNTATEASSNNSAIANKMGSPLINVCTGDVVEHESTTGGNHKMYFYEGKWV